MSWTMPVPPLYGTAHLLIILIGGLLCLAALKMTVPLSEKEGKRLVAGTGFLLLFLEAYKQLFYYLVLNGRKYDWWIFPFQLCSVPMYLCLLYPLMHRSHRRTVDTFLGTFTLIGALCALAYPQDMLKPYVVLTVHAFL